MLEGTTRWAVESKTSYKYLALSPIYDCLSSTSTDLSRTLHRSLYPDIDHNEDHSPPCLCAWRGGFPFVQGRSRRDSQHPHCPQQCGASQPGGPSARCAGYLEVREQLRYSIVPNVRRRRFEDLYTYLEVPLLIINTIDQLVSVSGEHQYVAPGPGDIRGPCPGLNAAANHGCRYPRGKKPSCFMSETLANLLPFAF